MLLLTVLVTHVKISQLVNKMCLQQACQQFVTMLLFQGCHSQLVELQDDNKLLEQLLTSLLSTKQVVTKQASCQLATTQLATNQVVNKSLTTCQQAVNNQTVNTSCGNAHQFSLPIRVF